MQAMPPTLPGLYPGGGLAPLLRANEQQFLFQNQLLTAAQVTAGQASIAVQLERTYKTGQFGASVQIWFTNASGVPADPGAFAVQVQASDIDADPQYSDELGLTGGLNASFSGRVELESNWMKYLRVRVPTFANVASVFVNALVSR